MAIKGPSNHYGNSKHGRNGYLTSHIGYQWAKSFRKDALKSHAEKHGKEYGLEGYEAKAVTFANRVDRVNHLSYVRKNGTTVKYSKKTNEFIVVDRSGHVTTYYCPSSGIEEYYKDRRHHI